MYVKKVHFQLMKIRNRWNNIESNDYKLIFNYVFKNSLYGCSFSFHASICLAYSRFICRQSFEKECKFFFLIDLLFWSYILDLFCFFFFCFAFFLVCLKIGQIHLWCRWCTHKHNGSNIAFICASTILWSGSSKTKISWSR